MYGLTVLYGIWDLHDAPGKVKTSTGWAIVSTIIFTIFFAMMIVSHVLTVVTSPGEMPRNYEKLHEGDLPKQFYKLISLRESLYAEIIVKKKMRKGELTKESIPNFAEVLRMSRSSRASQVASERTVDTNPTASRSGSIALEEEKRLIGSGDEPDALKDNRLLRTAK